jgi:hypothetical protein
MKSEHKLIAFKSSLALKFARLSCLGFLGFLGALGFIPGWERLLGFSGFFGFFGFLGVAYIIDGLTRSRTSPSGPENSSPSAH